jgi:hypothetical protein
LQKIQCAPRKWRRSSFRNNLKFWIQIRMGIFKKLISRCFAKNWGLIKKRSFLGGYFFLKKKIFIFRVCSKLDLQLCGFRAFWENQFGRVSEMVLFCMYNEKRRFRFFLFEDCQNIDAKVWPKTIQEVFKT